MRMMSDMNPLATEYDEEYAAEYSAALADAAQHRNDANRQPVRRRSPIYTLNGRVCQVCGGPMDDGGNCDPQRQCDGVL
jgi:hypothetical protein